MTGRNGDFNYLVDAAGNAYRGCRPEFVVRLGTIAGLMANAGLRVVYPVVVTNPREVALPLAGTPEGVTVSVVVHDNEEST